MLADVHNHHGVLNWYELLEPAIKLSDHGFKVSKRLNKLLSWAPHLKNNVEAKPIEDVLVAVFLSVLLVLVNRLTRAIRKKRSRR